MIQLAPYVRILHWMVDALAMADWSEAGIVGMTVRHGRNREPVLEERPCIDVHFVTDEWTGDDDLNNWEKQRALKVNLEVNVALPPEDSAADLTGYDTLSRIGGVAMRALRGAADLPSSLVDWFALGEVSPSDTASPDDGGLVLEVTAYFRVKSTDEHVLLAVGA